MRKGQTGRDIKGVMTDEEFEKYKEKMIDEMLLDIKEAFPKEYEEYLKRTTGPKRKLDL